MAFFPKFALQNNSNATTPGATLVSDTPGRISGVFAQRLAARGNGSGLVQAQNQQHTPSTPASSTGKAATSKAAAGTAANPADPNAETEIPESMLASMMLFFKNQGSFKLPNADPWEDD